MIDNTLATDEKIFVTQPTLPPLDKFVACLEDIWDRKWLTNNGKYHQEFEQAICDYLGVKYCSLFANGTLGLIVGLQALRITGEVITTPYSFVASTHSLHWNGIEPVFCDIDPETLNLDVKKIESLITSKTTAILPVHVYGHPCQVDEIQQLADNYGLKVIYDAAHAFGVKVNGDSIANHGDLSVLSFHATKVFNTIEGGAIITNDEKLKKRIDYAKNFGFASEVSVVAPGINAKMNELQAAYGLLQLETVAEEIKKRQGIANFYRDYLSGIEGITCFYDKENVKANYSYFPILVDKKKFGISRDALYEIFKKNNILVRRYFYPLISEFSMYQNLPSASKDKLPVASRAALEILCLPLYGDLERSVVENIVTIISSQKG